MGPQNSVVGDINAVNIPETVVPEYDLTNEKNMAKFSKSKEFAKLKEHIDIRIEFYKHFLPNGDEVALNARPTAEDWQVANRVIGELKAILNAYENAREVVDNVSRRAAEL